MSRMACIRYVYACFGMMFMWQYFHHVNIANLLTSTVFGNPVFCFELNSNQGTLAWYGAVLVVALVAMIATGKNALKWSSRLNVSFSVLVVALTVMNTALSATSFFICRAVAMVALLMAMSISFLGLVISWGQWCSIAGNGYSKKVMYVTCMSVVLNFIVSSLLREIPYCESTVTILAPLISSIFLVFAKAAPASSPHDQKTGENAPYFAMPRLRLVLIVTLVVLLIAATCAIGLYEVVIVRGSPTNVLLKHAITIGELMVIMLLCLRTAGVERFSFVGWAILVGYFILGLVMLAFAPAVLCMDIGYASVVATRSCLEVFIFLNLICQLPLARVPWGLCALLVAPVSVSYIVGYGLLPDILVNCHIATVDTMARAMLLIASLTVLGILGVTIAIALGGMGASKASSSDPSDRGKANPKGIQKDSCSLETLPNIKTCMTTRSVLPNTVSDEQILSKVAFLATDYGLTPREKDVAILVFKGYSVKHIAETLVVSVSTVQSHMRNLYRKLDIHCRQDLIEMIEREV